MGPYGGGEGRHPTVLIEKAENGYLVTLSPAIDTLGMGDFMGVGEFPDPERVTKLRKDQEKFSPKVFVFADIQSAWDAVQNFLLDGRMPALLPPPTESS